MDEKLILPIVRIIISISTSIILSCTIFLINIIIIKDEIKAFIESSAYIYGLAIGSLVIISIEMIKISNYLIKKIK